MVLTGRRLTTVLNTGVWCKVPYSTQRKPVLRIRIRTVPGMLFWASWIRIHYQAKIVKKNFIPTVLWLFYDFLSLENNVNIASKSNKEKKIF
jgi:hypothetical protein